AQGAVNILYRRDLIATEEAGNDVEARRAGLIEDYETALLNPYEAANSGYIDAVIAPSETRAQVIHALRATSAKRQCRPAKKHGNTPLSPHTLSPPASESRAQTYPRKEPPLY